MWLELDVHHHLGHGAQAFTLDVKVQLSS